jgi:hypothetical protein
MPTQPGDLYIATSANLGATWGAEAVLFTDSVDSYDARDPRITVSSTGRWIVFFFLHDGTNTLPYIIYSDDSGSSWSAKVLVTNGYTSNIAACSGPILQLANGDLLAPLYGPSSNDIKFSRSTDDGATWADDGVTITGDQDLTEPNIGHLADGSILCLIRASGTKQIYRSIGTYTAGTGAVSWTSPSAACDGEAAPGFCQDSGGTIHMLNRNVQWNAVYSAASPTCILTSDDNGATWSDPITVFPGYDYSEYGAPIELPDGSVWLFYAEEGITGSRVWWAPYIAATS